MIMDSLFPVTPGGKFLKVGKKLLIFIHKGFGGAHEQDVQFRLFGYESRYLPKKIEIHVSQIYDTNNVGSSISINLVFSFLWKLRSAVTGLFFSIFADGFSNPRFSHESAFDAIKLLPTRFLASTSLIP